MEDQKINKVFNRYNHASDVVRCPYGRASTREILDSYAKAAVNLYGVISREDFVNIFNEQNENQTTTKEIYILLLPLVLKNEMYGFYKEYIVHFAFFYDIEEVDYLLEEQEKKPRYIPEKTLFLEYQNELFLFSDYLFDVHKFMFSAFGLKSKTGRAFSEIRECIYFSYGTRELLDIFNRNDIVFESDEQFQELLDLIMLAQNNTRMWQNNGYTPTELRDIVEKRDKKIVKFPTLKKEKIGRNEQCPCGSGKKYKHCCIKYEETKTAQLSTGECRLFYETWLGLIGFVNEQKSVVKVNIKPEYPYNVSDMLIHKVREVLWENPELIDEYISKTKLSQEKIDILKLWKTNHKKDNFLLYEYQDEYAVIIASNSQGEDRLYGVKGASNSIANVLRRDLPVYIETVLLPFKGKIIYDTFIASMPISFAEGARKAFSAIYDKANEHDIITKLE